MGSAEQIIRFHRSLYHLGPYAALEDAAATGIDELRNDTANIKDGYTVGPKACEDGLP